MGIRVDEETGLPVISPLSRNSQEEMEGTNQVVMNFMVRDWKILGWSVSFEIIMTGLLLFLKKNYKKKTK